MTLTEVSEILVRAAKHAKQIKQFGKVNKIALTCGQQKEYSETSKDVYQSAILVYGSVGSSVEGQNKV